MEKVIENPNAFNNETLRVSWEHEVQFFGSLLIKSYNVWLCKECFFAAVWYFYKLEIKSLCDSYFTRWSWKLTQPISFINVAEYNTDRE